MRKLCIAFALLLVCFGCQQTSKETPDESTKTAAPSQRIVKLTTKEAAEAKKVFDANCAGCHGDRGRGDGPASKVLQVKPRDFVMQPFKIRSTASGQSPTRQDIFDTVTRGLPGSAMPAFDFLPEKDRWLAVDYVRKLANLDSKPDPQIIELGKAPGATESSIQRGKQIYAKMKCEQCHGLAGRGDGPSSATLVDTSGNNIPARDYTKGEYLGGNTSSAIAMRFLSGMDGTPMPSYTGLMTTEETWDLAHYILSLRQPAAVPPADLVARGKMIVDQKQCTACHVLDGKGGEVGPSLDSAAAKLQYNWVRTFLKDPVKQGKIYYYMPYRMPNLHLKADEVEAVVALFASMAKRSTQDPKEETPKFDDSKIAQGKLIYVLKCAECHNMGTVIPTPEAKQQGPDLIHTSNRILYKWMPIWVNNPKQFYPQARMVDTNLSPEEIEAVQAFVWSTSAHAKK